MYLVVYLSFPFVYYVAASNKKSKFSVVVLEIMANDNER